MEATPAYFSIQLSEASSEFFAPSVTQRRPMGWPCPPMPTSAHTPSTFLKRQVCGAPHAVKSHLMPPGPPSRIFSALIFASLSRWLSMPYLPPISRSAFPWPRERHRRPGPTPQPPNISALHTGPAASPIFTACIRALRVSRTPKQTSKPKRRRAATISRHRIERRTEHDNMHYYLPTIYGREGPRIAAQTHYATERLNRAMICPREEPRDSSLLRSIAEHIHGP